MNKTYRLVFNRALGLWQAVTELARSRSKSASGKSRVVRAAGLAAGLGLSLGTAQAELPTGGEVVAGSGVISQSGSTLTVTQSSDKLATNWQSFSIGSGNRVEFVQPGSNAVALNRVLGSDVSVIQGALSANGQVFLVNPNGVLFSPTAQVDVGGLVASTLALSTEDFLAGNYVFEGTSTASVVNEGQITAAGGVVALVAARIVNTGSISAPDGSVLMGAGSRVRLDLGGPVQIEVESGALDALIANGGGIRADGGVVYLTARGAVEVKSSEINQTGLI
jgi:filamentous hemagglutinin family protein